MDLPCDIGHRVGLLGGTFDPVHNGHLAIAAHARKQCRLDAVVFIPAANPPHKEPQTISAWHHRRRMLDLACGSGSGYYVTSLEAERRGLSYTVDTLHTLKDYFPSETELFFIIGSDSFVDLPTWKEPERLMEFANLVVVSRGSQDATAMDNVLSRFFPAYRAVDAENIYWSAKYQGAIILLDMAPVAISATGVRESVRQEKSIRELVPAAVAAYIEENGLYRRKEEAEISR